MATRSAPLLLVIPLLLGPLRAVAQRDSGLVDIHAVVPAVRIAQGEPPILVRPAVAAALAKVARRLATGGVALEVMAGRKDLEGHRDGKAIDCRLVDLTRGTPIPMGSDYSEGDRPDSTSAGGREQRYRGLLNRIMTEEGFVGDAGRWWHWTAGERRE